MGRLHIILSNELPSVFIQYLTEVCSHNGIRCNDYKTFTLCFKDILLHYPNSIHTKSWVFYLYTLYLDRCIFPRYSKLSIWINMILTDNRLTNSQSIGICF